MGSRDILYKWKSKLYFLSGTSHASPGKHSQVMSTATHWVLALRSGLLSPHSVSRKWVRRPPSSITPSLEMLLLVGLPCTWPPHRNDKAVTLSGLCYAIHPASKSKG